MKTNMKTRRTDVEKSDKDQSLENCKLERLKMAGAYALAPQAEAWAEGISVLQKEVGCAVVRKTKRPGLRRRRPITASRAP